MSRSLRAPVSKSYSRFVLVDADWRIDSITGRGEELCQDWYAIRFLKGSSLEPGKG
jgi:hypothetical protein